jgi:hypothetical protein
LNKESKGSFTPTFSIKECQLGEEKEEASEGFLFFSSYFQPIKHACTSINTDIIKHLLHASISIHVTASVSIRLREETVSQQDTS